MNRYLTILQNNNRITLLVERKHHIGVLDWYYFFLKSAFLDVSNEIVHGTSIDKNLVHGT